MSNLVVDAIGWTGAALVLSAYLLITTKKLGSESKLYQSMNLFGAMGLTINGYVNGAFPSVGVNVVWSFIALYGLGKGFKLSDRNQLPRT
jgi:hypothetical protein